MSVISVHIVFAVGSYIHFDQDGNVARHGEDAVGKDELAELYQWWYLIPALPFVLMSRQKYERKLTHALVNRVGSMGEAQKRALVVQSPRFESALCKLGTLVKKAQPNNLGTVIKKLVFKRNQLGDSTLSITEQIHSQVCFIQRPSPGLLLETLLSVCL